MTSALRVIVAQPNARAHFLVARALLRKHMLTKLVAGWYPLRWGPLCRWLERSRFKPLARAFGAYHRELPRERVWANNLAGLWSQVVLNATRKKKGMKAVMQFERSFSRRAARLQLPDYDVLWGYSYASLEMAERAKSEGRRVVIDQIDTGYSYHETIAQEQDRWPSYAAGKEPALTEYFDRARREWQLADVIQVNSDWTKNALLAEGVCPDKIEIIPLAYEGPIGPISLESPAHRDRLRVLWLGNVTLGKGIPYLVEAARLLMREPVEFRVVGALGISPEATKLAPPNVHWLGPVPRNQTGDLYRSSDVFVLPTLSDGFAITQLEALSHGLPLIVTPNCGRVVEDGRTGFLIPARDPQALADAVLRFVRQPEMLESMRPQCIESVRSFSVDAFADRMAEMLCRRFGKPGQSQYASSKQGIE